MNGVVVSDKMEKTVVVSVETTKRHPLYNKVLRRAKKYLAHDENQEAREGDFVRIEETRPMSRRKRWRVVDIIRRG
jgi:small subunit ribosomal protein S17